MIFHAFLQFLTFMGNFSSIYIQNIIDMIMFKYTILLSLSYFSHLFFLPLNLLSCFYIYLFIFNIPRHLHYWPLFPTLYCEFLKTCSKVEIILQWTHMLPSPSFYRYDFTIFALSHIYPSLNPLVNPGFLGGHNAKLITDISTLPTKYFSSHIT